MLTVFFEDLFFSTCYNKNPKVNLGRERITYTLHCATPIPPPQKKIASPRGGCGPHLIISPWAHLTHHPKQLLTRV